MPMKLKDNEYLIAWVALGISIIHAAISLTLYIRGSDVTATPKSALLYVQETGDGASVLSGAIQVLVTNRSRWYGDAFIDSDAKFVEEGSLHSFEGLVQPRFGAECPENLRCNNLSNLSVQFFDDDVVIVPPSSAKLIWISFEIPCAAIAEECRIGNARRTSRLMHSKVWDFEITSEFVDEGKLVINCSFGPVDGEFLTRTGWTSMDCS